MPHWTVTTQKFSLTKERFRKISWHYQRKSYIILQLCGLALVDIGLLLFMRSYYVPIFLGASAAILLYVHLIYSITLVRAANNKQNKAFYMPMRFTIDDEKLHVEQDPATLSEAPWSRVVSYFVNDGDLVLFLNSVNFWFLPRSAFETPEDWSRVYGYVTETIPLRK